LFERIWKTNKQLIKHTHTHTHTHTHIHTHTVDQIPSKPTKIYNERTIKSELFSFLKRQSQCQLEIDSQASEILNLKYDDSSSFGDIEHV